MAQTTYSQNVVGYINQVLPANGYQIIGNTLTLTERRPRR